MSEVINPTGEQLYLATKHTHDSSGEVINPATKELQEEVSQKLEQVKAAIEEIQQVAGEVQVTNLPETQKVVADQPLPVSINGTTEGLLADRPNPGTVPIGTRYWAVDTGEYAVSTGTTWRVLGVV